MRTAIFQVVRQRLTPSASEPSSQPGRTERSPSEKIETISGAIITVRISDRRQQAVAAERDHAGDRGLLRLGDQVVADEGDDHQHAEQAVDHRGDAGQEADHRLQDVAHPLRRELDDEDGDEERARRGRSATAPPVIRIVLQISGQAWKV